MISLTLFAVYFFSYPSLFSAQPSFNPITFQAHPRDSRHILSSRDNLKTGFNLSNDNNLQYYTEVSIGGQNITLSIDTGSSDLLVHSNYPLITTNRTNIPVNVSYAIGSASGNIVFGPACIGGYCIPEQAFVDVEKVEQQTGQGTLGLSLGHLSVVYRTADTFNMSSRALPPLYNIFNQNSTLPHFIGILLERSIDMERTAGGQISIGEYDPRFEEDITLSQKHPLVPANTSRWTIAMEQLSINGHVLANMTSAVQGADANKSIALIDSGATLSYIPQEALDFIYGNIPGAIHISDGQWAIPCLQSANLTFSFPGGESFAIDPLDLTLFQNITKNNQQWTICVNAFQVQMPVDEADPRHADFLLGDLFMRNVYSVFNYGDISSTRTQPPAEAGAYIRLLSRTNQSEVMQRFATQRNETLKSLPPLYDIRHLKDGGL